MSPAFVDPDKGKWNYVRDFLARKSRPPVFIYIDNGGVGLEQTLQPGVDKMLSVLRAKGYKEPRDFVFFKSPNAQHNETAWAARLPNAMKLVLTR